MSAELGTRSAELVKVQNEQVLHRTKIFALRVMRMVDALPRGRSAEVIGKQVLRSATSVGANYRAARLARSTQKFCSKLGIVEEEADECLYWFKLLTEGAIVRAEKLVEIQKEANEILAMIVSSMCTARKKNHAL